MSRRFRLVLSAACALLAVTLCLLYSQRVRGEAEAVRAEALERYGGEVTRLVVATGGLEVGDVVGKQNVAEREWLSDLAPADAVTSMDDVVGKQVTVPVAEGVPLTALNFREGDAMAEVPSGYVALSVPVTEKLGLSSAVEVGTKLAAYEVTDTGTKLLSADIQVLLAPGSGSSGAAALSKGSLSVAVRPADVTMLLAASTEGSLRLVIPAKDASVGEGENVAAPSKVDAEKGTDAASAGVADASGEADAKAGEVQ